MSVSLVFQDIFSVAVYLQTRNYLYLHIFMATLKRERL